MKIFTYLEYRISRMGDTAVVSSADNVKKIRNARSDKRAYHLFDGVDTSNYADLADKKGGLRRKHGISADKIVVVYTGGLVRNKGIQTILDAAKILHKNDKIGDLHFVIGGDAGDWIVDFVENNTIQKYFTIIYPLNYFHLPEINILADIAIDPKNAHSKQASGKILQYAAAGTAIICADRKTNRAYLGQGGFYISDLNAQTLADKISEISKNEKERAIKAVQAQDSMEKYGWCTVGKRLEGVYKSVI